MLDFIKKIDDKIYEFEKKHYVITILCRHIVYIIWFLFGLYQGYKLWG